MIMNNKETIKETIKKINIAAVGVLDDDLVLVCKADRIIKPELTRPNIKIVFIRTFITSVGFITRLNAAGSYEYKPYKIQSSVLDVPDKFLLFYFIKNTEADNIISHIHSNKIKVNFISDNETSEVYNDNISIISSCDLMGIMDSLDFKYTLKDKNEN